MAECIVTEHLVPVDGRRLGVMLAATYQVDQGIEVLEQLCEIEGLDEQAWRRLMRDSLVRLRATNEVGMACLDEGRASTAELELRLQRLS